MLVPISVPRAPQDFDPFHIPMPVVAPGVTAETVRPSLPTCPTPLALWRRPRGLSPAQTHQLQLALLPDAMALSDLPQAFAELDADGDGVIRGEEFGGRTHATLSSCWC